MGKKKKKGTFFTAPFLCAKKDGSHKKAVLNVI